MSVFFHIWCLHILHLYLLRLICYSDWSVFRLQLLHKDMNGMKPLHQHRIMTVARWIDITVVQAWEVIAMVMTMDYIKAIQILEAISQVGDIRAWMHNRISETKKKHFSHASRMRMLWNLSKSLFTVCFQYMAACPSSHYSVVENLQLSLTFLFSFLSQNVSQFGTQYNIVLLKFTFLEWCRIFKILCFLFYFILIFSDIPPNQGGRYSGFGYTMDPPPRSTSQEFFDSAVSSLASVSLWLLGLHLSIICAERNSVAAACSLKFTV